MFSQLVVNQNQSLKSQLAHAGEPSDSESTREPPTPDTSYKPYSETPALPEPPYEPYSEKPVEESPYEPYKGM